MRLSGERTYSRTVERALRTSSAARRRGGSWSWPAPASGKAIAPSYAKTGPRPAERTTGVVVLVDTSVWIEVFRRDGRFRLQDEVDLEEVVTCPPVVQEVLQGFRDERAFRVAREAMYALPIVESPLRAAVVNDAVDLYRRARGAGRSVRSGVDCLIAACALRHGLLVLHRDRDFLALATVSALRERAIVRRRGGPRRPAR